MNSKNVLDVFNIIFGVCFVLLAFYPDKRPFTLIPVFIGFLFIIFGLSGLYSKTDFISKKIYKIAILPMIIIESFIVIYIFVVIPESRYIILGIALIIIIFAIFVAIISVIWRKKVSKYQKGIKILGDLNYNDAFEYFDEYVKSKPNDPLAWSGKAFALLRLNKLDESLECVNKAMEIKLGFKYFLVKKFIYSIQIYAKACVLFELEKYEDALEYIDELLEIRPNYSPYWNTKGTILGKLGNYEGALESFNEALRLDPKDPFALSNKGETLRKIGDYSEAMEYIDRAIYINPKIPFIWLTKGETLMAMNKNGEALKYIDKALELDPIFKNAIKAKEELSKLIGD